jgi:hypothetical protein
MTSTPPVLSTPLFPVVDLNELGDYEVKRENTKFNNVRLLSSYSPSDL